MVGLGGLEPPTSPLSVLRSWSRSVILRDTGCGPARQSKADALARVAATRGGGASKEQQALACLGTQAERPRFQDGILEGMLGHSRSPSPTSSTRDLPCGNARRAPNRWHPRVSRRRPYPLRNPPHERSEEHTSELQSRRDLVCRLL